MSSSDALAKRTTAIAALALAAATMVLLRLAIGDALWTEGEGVYALTARMLLHGDELYRVVVVAQPPGTVLVGGLALAVHDSLHTLRDGMALVQIASGLLCGGIVWGLTRSRTATILTPALSLLTPWAVHENATLIPETVAMPFLLGATLLCTRPRGSGAAGFLSAIAVFVKYPMALPAAALIFAARNRRRYLLFGGIAVAVQIAVYSAAFGAANIWRETVVDQLEASGRSLHLLGGIFAQATWNSAVLVVFAGAAILLRRNASDAALMRAAIATATGVVLTAFTIAHTGTGLYVLATVELACLPLAVSGVVWVLGGAHRRAGLLVAALAGAALLAQSVSLLASPADPRLFVRPGAANGYAVNYTAAQVHLLTGAARRCPRALAYSGTPFLAFTANRRMPANQPDNYITVHSKHLASVRAAISRDQPRCP